MDDILILHNTFGPADDPLYQSRAGVCDQIEMVEKSCKKLAVKYTILPVENLMHLMNLLKERKEKIIFNLIEEFIGNIEQTCFVPAICQAFRKSCTGSGTSALAMAQNKFQTKAILAASGIDCPAGVVVAVGTSLNPNLLNKGTYILKPAFSDASEGITIDCVVRLPAENEKAKLLVEQMHGRFNQPVIVEQFIAARELNVSLIERNGKVNVMPIAEIDFSAFSDNQPRIIDYAAKWQKDSFAYNNTPRKIPADLNDDLRKKIEQIAVSVWQAVVCRDYIRVDFRLDEDNKPYVLEVNPNPDISADAGFAAAIQTAGIAYEQFVATILENTKQRLIGV